MFKLILRLYTISGSRPDITAIYQRFETDYCSCTRTMCYGYVTELLCRVSSPTIGQLENMENDAVRSSFMYERYAKILTDYIVRRVRNRCNSIDFNEQDTAVLRPYDDKRSGDCMKKTQYN